MDDSVGLVQKSKLVVGLDFGTKLSGFAYALRSDPDKIRTFYDWPMQAEAGALPPYCKTQTSLLYAGASDPQSDDPFQLLEWGWPAFLKYRSFVADSAPDDAVTQSMDSHWLSSRKEATSGVVYFVTLFKLLLRPQGSTSTSPNISLAPTLPPGLTARRVITDYLRQFSTFILQEVKDTFGSHISLGDIEWCLTVPAIWDEHAKKEMGICSELAGLVQGPLDKDDAGSPHPLKLFTEPEAASAHCQQKLKDYNCSKYDKVLVVDCAGETVEIVGHQELGSGLSVSSSKVQESSGDFCGGFQVEEEVEEEFFRLMEHKISCFERFRREYPTCMLQFWREWGRVMYEFDGEATSVSMELPPKLADMWEMDESCSSLSYDEIVLTNADMKSILDPVVTKILLLVFQKLGIGLKAIMVVGESPISSYLMRRMQATFGDTVKTIMSPPCPGISFCSGAVTMGLRSDIARDPKKVYGIRVAVPFIPSVQPVCSGVDGDSERAFIHLLFDIFVPKGDEVLWNDHVKQVVRPIRKCQTAITVDLYSIDRKDAEHVADSGIQLEGTFTVQFPSRIELGFDPKVQMSIVPGHGDVQATAIGLNFDCMQNKLPPINFERHSIY